MEMLVGIGIGMICVIIIFQVVALWENSKRTTTAGSDLQINGTLATYSLERDLKLAGLGLGTANASTAGCVVSAYNADRTPSQTFNFDFLPVKIEKNPVDATDLSRADVIKVLYGNSPLSVTDVPVDASTTTTKTVRSRAEFRLGDIVVIHDTSSNSCTMVEVTGYVAADSLTFQHLTGNYNSFYGGASVTSKYNEVGGTPASYSSGQAFTLGPAPKLNVWTVTRNHGTLPDNNLVWHNELSANTSDSATADNIINLRAQYGIDGLGGCAVDDRIVDGGCNGGKGEWTDTLPTGQDPTKIRAIRFALLARSQFPERDIAVTQTAPNPSWAAAGEYLFGIGGGTDTSWQFYRYRVYERVVALRNMIWGTAP
jgi:type IV pilus assembly protein PilW